MMALSLTWWTDETKAFILLFFVTPARKMKWELSTLGWGQIALGVNDNERTLTAHLWDK